MCSATRSKIIASRASGERVASSRVVATVASADAQRETMLLSRPNRAAASAMLAPARMAATTWARSSAECGTPRVTAHRRSCLGLLRERLEALVHGLKLGLDIGRRSLGLARARAREEISGVCRGVDFVPLGGVLEVRAAERQAANWAFCNVVVQRRGFWRATAGRSPKSRGVGKGVWGIPGRHFSDAGVEWRG